MRSSGLFFFISLLLLAGSAHAQAHRIRKMERQAANRLHLTLVRGDTVENVSIWQRHPRPRPTRTYYWYSQAYIRHTMGDYTGQLLHGPYRLLDREQHLLISGAFKKGLQNGLWRTWRLDGTLASSSQWRRGQQRGATQFYDLSGKLIKPAKVRKEKHKTHRLAAFWHRLLPKKDRKAKAAPELPTAAPATEPVAPHPALEPTPPTATKPPKQPKVKEKKAKKRAKDQNKASPPTGKPATQ